MTIEELTTGRPPKGTVNPPQEWQHILGRAERGEIRIGPDAARQIARGITAQGGFWDHPGRSKP